MVLLHVCRPWRSIAISTHPLWASLGLDLSSLPKKFLTTGQYENLLTDWLTRVGGCPLTLDLFGFDVGDPEEDARRLIPTTLNSLASRIQTLHLCIDPDDYPEHTPNFPLLRRLQLSFPFAEDDSEREISIQSPIQTFTAAPLLRDIDMSNKAGPSLFAISWDQLTIFAGEELSSRDCVDLLRLAPSLRECTFDAPHIVPDTPNVSHFGLKRLNIRENGDVLFPFLTLPVLQTLKVTLFDPTEIQHILHFISRSSTSLLNISGLAVAQLPVHCLLDMIALTDLNLRNPVSSYLVEFFGLLNRAKNPSFLPQLQVLVLSWCEPYAYEDLVPALSSRRAVAQDGGVRLRSFRRDPGRKDWIIDVDRGGEIYATLKELTEDGMEIDLGMSCVSLSR